MKRGIRSRLLTVLMCAVMLVTLFVEIPNSVMAEGETVTVTVNYVYASNQAMVSQPYSASIGKGDEFKKTLAVPSLLNYSVPTDKAEGLEDGKITLNGDSLVFNIDSVSDDITVTLYYVAGQTTYKVYHHYQNLENDDYGEVIEREVTGDIDAYTKATAENRQGFICKGVPELTVAADGTTVVDIYYDRAYYTVVYDVNGGVNGPKPVYAKYGTTIDTPVAPVRTGYIFAGWSPDWSDTVTEDVTYKAQWKPEKGQADYTIVLWGQNANDDEYSYLSSHDAWGNVGGQVTWNEGTLISHVHTEDCKKLTCELEEHTHSDERLTCGKTEHTHDASCCSLEEHTHSVLCYSGASSKTSSAGLGAPFNPTNGTIARQAWTTNEKVIYFNGTWYEYNGNASNGDVARMDCGKTEHTHGTGCNHDKCGLEEHTHSDACYGCGKTEHTHNADCYSSCDIPDSPKKYMSAIRPDSALWVFDHSDTVTVDANGSTVLNVYFKRTEFTLHFRKARSNKDDYGSITARWGEDISEEYKAIVKKAGSSFWSRNRDASDPYTNYIGVMPEESRIYYNKSESGTNNTMYYYAQDLNGQYEEIFSISFGGNYSVTDEDRYKFEGFTYDHGTANGSDCNGAEFYYKRNRYNLEFYSSSNSKPDKTETPMYQEPLGKYYYEPTDKPSTVEEDAVFVGWYLNPECTGEEFDLDAHTMPSNNIALYAKWVNGLYTVETFTDESMTVPYTYEGYDGKQENIEKYTLADAPTDPKMEGKAFVGWRYLDENGVEQPFSFTMPITQNYKLYPKFSDKVMVTYTVHYYIKDTETKVAEDRTNTVMIGSYVTEKAKMGTDLNLVAEGTQNKYYPDKTSTSVQIVSKDQEIIFYYTEATTMPYTVKYVDAQGNDILEPKYVEDNEMSIVTESYVPIENYTPRQFRITKELSSNAEENVIVFIYDANNTELTVNKSIDGDVDPNQTFIFKIRGVDESNKDFSLDVTIHGSGSVTIKDIPVGRYSVTEDNSWSWRYDVAESSAVTIIKTLNHDASKNNFDFVNKVVNDKWLDSDDYKVNLFTGSN